MRHCQFCDIDTSNHRCPKCAGITTRAHDDWPDPLPGKPVVSVVDDTLDTMIEKASRPSLATLVRAGIQRGLITPVQDYANGKFRTK